MQHEAGQLPEAIKSFEQALNLDSWNHQASATLNSLLIEHADSLEKSGDHERAFETIRPLLESENPPLGAVLVFAKLSPIFDMQDDCRYLLQKISAHSSLSEAEKAVIQQALNWLDQH